MIYQPTGLSETIFKEISLTKGKVSIVDAEDYDYLNQWKRHARKGNTGIWYANRRISNSTIDMHRVILDTAETDLVDHLDGDGLNNQRVNLRICDSTNNARNRKIQKNSSSGYKGVHKVSKGTRNPWKAMITVKGTSIHLGVFPTPEEAHEAYKKAFLTYCGKIGFNREWIGNV